MNDRSLRCRAQPNELGYPGRNGLSLMEIPNDSRSFSFACISQRYNRADTLSAVPSKVFQIADCVCFSVSCWCLGQGTSGTRRIQVRGDWYNVYERRLQRPLDVKPSSKFTRRRILRFSTDWKHLSLPPVVLSKGKSCCCVVCLARTLTLCMESGDGLLTR
jgi:hypothetical protein